MFCGPLENALLASKTRCFGSSFPLIFSQYKGDVNMKEKLLQNKGMFARGKTDCTQLVKKFSLCYGLEGERGSQALPGCNSISTNKYLQQGNTDFGTKFF